ncbi:MAG: hypothetical protein ACTSRU_14875 [Candidatus Hodarchaeales archaeon]
MSMLGIYHRMDYDIVDHAATLRGNGNNISDARKELLKYALKFGIKKGVVRKRIQPAMKVWLDKDNKLSEDISKAYIKSNKKDKLAFNLAMMFFSYPAFYDILSIIGSTGMLSGQVDITTIRDRMERKYGQTSSVKQMVSKSIQSLVSWKILKYTRIRGIYSYNSNMQIGNLAIEMLIIGILKGSSKRGYPIDDILREPSLFPFNVKDFDHTKCEYLKNIVEGNGIQYIYLDEK